MLRLVAYKMHIQLMRKPLNILQDVCPISDFRENASSIVARIRTDRRPLIITQHGKSSAALIPAESYQEMLDRIQILTDIAESEEDVASGGGIEQDVLRKELMAKYKA